MRIVLFNMNGNDDVVSKSHLSLQKNLNPHKLHTSPNLTYSGPTWGSNLSQRDWS